MGRGALWRALAVLAGGCVARTHAELPKAYLTLVSGPEWVLAARTLAQSMLEAGCTLPRLVLFTYAPSATDVKLLQSEGWTVREVPRLPNPFNDEGAMTRQTFSQIWAYNQTDYSRLIYIDVDFIVLENIDTLTECGEWCAVKSLRETQGRFNAGLQVLTPNRDLFLSLVSAARRGLYSSYNSGVQGFLNEAIPRWCTHDDIKSWPDLVKVPRKAEWHNCQQLNERFNHIAVIANTEPRLRLPMSASADDLYGKVDWQYQSSPPAALHFNHPAFWTIKPWCWQWYPVLPEHWLWWQHRQKVAGEVTKAVVAALLGTALPLLCTVAYSLAGGQLCETLTQQPRFPTAVEGACVTRCLVTSASLHHRAAGAISAFQNMAVLAAETRLRRVAWVGLASILSSTCLFLLFPYYIDAVVAWTSYFAIKGMLLMAAVSSITFEADARVDCAVRGYLCALIEMALIWMPQLTVGVNWISDKALHPLCSIGSSGFENWTFQKFGCNLTLLFSCILTGVSVLLLQLLVLLRFQKGRPPPAAKPSKPPATVELEARDMEKQS